MPAPKVVVIGLDGLEPKIVESMLAKGELPHLGRLKERGGYARCATTIPAQTPVAWSTFATGVNPGGHGIYDFVRRDPATYLPDLALNRYEQPSPFLPPRAVNLRRGTTIWQVLSDAGVPSIVIRCPCSYPPEKIEGRMLAGMGVPDIRGGLGTATFYTSNVGVAAGEGEQIVTVHVERDRTVATHLIGPRNPKTREDVRLQITVRLDDDADSVSISASGVRGSVRACLGQWSDWMHVTFRLGMLQKMSGMVRFLLVRKEPVFELYASPVNFEPAAPPFPVSYPDRYAAELEQEIGTFYTAGMVEDHNALSNGRLDEEQYLEHCRLVMRERERMLFYELDRFVAGALFCLFDTPDRLQHMFWRFTEPDHPANRGAADARWSNAIADHYRECDAVVGRVLQRVDDRTLVIVLSDHGFNSFQRGVHVNAWLRENGFLALEPGVAPDEEDAIPLRHIDWTRTKAYALGLGSIYLNLGGREASGIVSATEASSIKRDIAAGLTALCDQSRGARAVRRVVAREDVYSGPYLAEAPDLIVLFERGYRVSWATALGGVTRAQFEDNVHRWSGDHIVDPSLVPGVLFMNRRFAARAPALLDLAPTILNHCGVPKGSTMEGTNLLQR